MKRALTLPKAAETVVEIEDLIDDLVYKVAFNAQHGYVIGRTIAHVKESIQIRVERLAKR